MMTSSSPSRFRGFLQVDQGIDPKWNWPRFSLVRAMTLVACVAIVLGLIRWWDENDWNAPLRHAWNDPITFRASRHDDLETVLKRLGLAMRRPKLKYGPRIVVDPGGLREASRTLVSPIGMDYDVKDMPAGEFLEQVLKPLGLACKLGDRKVMITSSKSPDEPIDYGHHGEIFCGHNDGPWVTIRNTDRPWAL
jgi:hypothetical protein